MPSSYPITTSFPNKRVRVVIVAYVDVARIYNNPHLYNNEAHATALAESIMATDSAHFPEDVIQWDIQYQDTKIVEVTEVHEESNED